MTPDMKDLILFSIEVFQAMLTPVIGITTAYIAWQQYRIARYTDAINLASRLEGLRKQYGSSSIGSSRLRIASLGLLQLSLFEPHSVVIRKRRFL